MGQTPWIFALIKQELGWKRKPIANSVDLLPAILQVRVKFDTASKACLMVLHGRAGLAVWH